MSAIKGMVQVAGVTYRVVRVAPKAYDAVRLLDDTRIGSFRTVPTIEITAANGVEPAVIFAIARAAIQGAKTSWVGRVTPL
jgi:hypothetical protein